MRRLSVTATLDWHDNAARLSINPKLVHVDWEKQYSNVVSFQSKKKGSLLIFPACRRVSEDLHAEPPNI